MADWTQGDETSALDHQLVTHPAVIKGNAVTCTEWDSVFLTLFHALVEAVANTNPGTFVVRGTLAGNGDDGWVILGKFTCSSGTVNPEVLTADEPPGETVIAVASTAGAYASGEWCYLDDISHIVQSEWRRIESVQANTSVTLVDGLTAAKNNTDSDVMYDIADVFFLSIDVRALKRFRVDFEHGGAAGANCHVKGTYVAATDFE